MLFFRMYEMFCIKVSFILLVFMDVAYVCECFFFNNCHPSFWLFAGKRISALATESYNSSVNYNRQKPSVIFCVQFSTFLYKCAIFYQFMNKPVQWDGCRTFVIVFLSVSIICRCLEWCSMMFHKVFNQHLHSLSIKKLVLYNFKLRIWCQGQFST